MKVIEIVYVRVSEETTLYGLREQNTELYGMSLEVSQD